MILRQNTAGGKVPNLHIVGTPSVLSRGLNGFMRTNCNDGQNGRLELEDWMSKRWRNCFPGQVTLGMWGIRNKSQR